MRTRFNLFRRNQQPAIREYTASAVIHIRADTKSLGYDMTDYWMATMSAISENPECQWIDGLDEGKVQYCMFEWDERNDCFRSKPGIYPLRKGQQIAFENFVRRVCEELRKVKTFSANVFSAKGEVTFSKCVHAAS